MRHISMMLLACFLLPPLYLACSSCKSNGGAAPDSSTDSSTDTDTDTDADTDTSTWISDAGPWEWEDNPPGEDCGPGCTQLTFTEEVRPLYWDVWEDYLVYRPDGPGERDYLFVVDLVTNQRMQILDMYEPIGSAYSAVFYPSVFGAFIYYSQKIYSGSQSTRQLIRADVSSQTQTILYSEDSGGADSFENLAYLDSYETNIVSQAGCGTEATYGNSLCLFDGSTIPAGIQTLIDDEYGNYNSIWGNILVFNDARPGIFDITGYDISTQQVFPVTNDDEWCQFFPRIHERKVVYGDTRFGEDQECVMGDLDHQAVFVYDLDTQEHTQITSGEWIAHTPDIWEEIIVWLDYRDAGQPNNINSFYNVQIWGYNLETEQEFKITNLPDYADPTRPKANPRIWGYRVFVDMAHPSPEIDNAIYMFDLPDGAR